MTNSSSSSFPFSSPSDEAESDAGELSTNRSTGVRPRTSSEDPILFATADALPGAPVAGSVPFQRASLAPESLRKPFASLAPPSKKERDTDTGPRRSTAGTWDEASSLSKVSSIAGRATRQTRSTCESHGIALSADGVCLLCKKERLESDKGRGWKILVAVMLVALAAGALLASSY
jgi:hypothetical protein